MSRKKTENNVNNTPEHRNSANISSDGMPVYQIHCTGRELRIIQNALERYFRLGAGQFFDYANDVVFDSSRYNNPCGTENHDAVFDEAVNRRDDAIDLFNKAYHTMTGHRIDRKTDAEMVAIDMWSAIRHELWREKPEPKLHDTAAAYSPRSLSGEPLIVVERVNGDES